MTIKKVIGTAPSQVPRNRDLGTMAYQDANAIQVGQLTTGNTLLVNRDSNGVHLQTQVLGENSATLGSYNSAPTIGSNKTGYSGIMFNGASYEPTLDGLNVRQSALVDIGSVNYRYKNGHFTGINFPATQVASANANTLDDYEEGTWTPTIYGQNGGALTLTPGNAYYTKIGNIVHVFAEQFTWTANSGLSANVILGGLPFASRSLFRSNTGGFGGSGAGSMSFTGQLVLAMDANTPTVWFIVKDPANNTYNHTPTFANSGLIYGFSLTYIAA